MLTGRQTLAELGRALEDVRRDAHRHDTAYQNVVQDLARNELLRNRRLQALARLRLAQLEDGDPPGWFTALESAERRALELLEARAAEVQSLRERIDTTEGQIEELETLRDERHVRVDAAARELAETEARVQRALDQDDAYQAQLARCRELAQTVEQAEQKAEVAAEDRGEKGRPYEADPLFMYLWGRGYGTASYDGGGLFRLLDGWVARICDYEPLRRQYWMLNEIPQRLRGHAEGMVEASDAALAALAALEDAAASAASVPALKDHLAEAEAEQDRVDADLATAEDALRELEQLESKFAMGTDEYLQDCLRGLAEAFDAEADRTLAELAAQSPGAEDDALVRQLADLRAEHEDLREELKDYEAVRTQSVSRLHELENVRRRFKQHRFDDLRSSFGNDQLVRAVLQEFLQGAISGAGLWDTLRRQQRYRDVAGAWPDFGTGGFPTPGRRRRRTPGRGSGWHWPGGRGGGFRLPRSGGSRSRGGFRTGGGF